MRPRSRLPSKRSPLLPTIREGSEETLREMNDANALHSGSSQDYFLSICHLAHPTFPTRDLATPLGSHAPDGRLGFPGLSDPLEHLYGSPGGGLRYGRRYERKRAHSIPNASTPDLTPQRKSSCPELQGGAPRGQGGCSPQTDMGKGRALEEGEETQGPGSIRPSLISQWISDCKSAWREARARACLLPAIAEI